MLILDNDGYKIYLFLLSVWGGGFGGWWFSLKGYSFIADSIVWSELLRYCNKHHLRKGCIIDLSSVRSLRCDNRILCWRRNICTDWFWHITSRLKNSVCFWVIGTKNMVPVPWNNYLKVFCGNLRKDGKQTDRRVTFIS